MSSPVFTDCPTCGERVFIGQEAMARRAEPCGECAGKGVVDGISCMKCSRTGSAIVFRSIRSSAWTQGDVIRAIGAAMDRAVAEEWSREDVLTAISWAMLGGAATAGEVALMLEVPEKRAEQLLATLASRDLLQAGGSDAA